MIGGIKRSRRAKRKYAPHLLPGIRKRIGKVAAFRSKVADAETARKRRQVQQNSAGALKFHGNRTTEVGMLTASQTRGDSKDVFIGAIRVTSDAALDEAGGKTCAGQSPPAMKRRGPNPCNGKVNESNLLFGAFVATANKLRGYLT